MTEPVLVGVGVAHGRGEEAAELMTTATRAAAKDAGAEQLLAAVQDIAVPEGTWSYTDPGRLIAESIGAPLARTVLAGVGVSQQTLVSRALALIADGAIDVALVVGGDTKHRASAAARAGLDAAEVDQAGAAPHEHLMPAGELMAPAEVQAGAWDPVVQYALIDNALAHAEGASIDEHRDDVAQLWARCNAVAAANPNAAFPQSRTAEFLREAGAENRLLAFPYNKWHSTQWRVDQAAALLLCSTAAATEAGVPRERRLFPLVALESSHALSLSRRRDLDRWQAMNLLGDAAANHLGRSLDAIEHTELYSCFPAAVRVQQRELGLPLDGTPTVTGGMAFAGGPFNNFTYQATAEIAARLRAEPGTLGLVTTVSGLLTKPGLMVWSTDAGPRPPLVADLAEAADAATPHADVVEGYCGPATVLTYTVTPERIVVIAEGEGGARVVATAADPILAADAMDHGLIGARIAVDGTTFKVDGGDDG